jgi:hypothetical protein
VIDLNGIITPSTLNYDLGRICGPKGQKSPCSGPEKTAAMRLVPHKELPMVVLHAKVQLNFGDMRLFKRQLF